MPWGPASFVQDWKVSPGTRGYILLPVDTKAVWKASQERTGLECSSRCCSGLLIHVWSLLGLAQLYLLPLLVLAFKRVLQMKKVACAVFWSKWKRKIPSSQACFQLLLCLCKAGRLSYFGALCMFPGCCYIVNAWLPSSIVTKGAALLLISAWI